MQVDLEVIAAVRDETGQAKAVVFGQVGSEALEGEGEARCRPDDHFNEKIGAGIALGRALQDAGKKLEERWAARAVSEAELQARRSPTEAQTDQGYLEYIEEIRGRPIGEVLR